MLYFDKKDLSRYIDADRVRYGEGRGEFGVCLHLPLKNYVAGADQGEDYTLMIAVVNNMIEFLLYKRLTKGSETWDYDPEAAAETYAVCGDNPSTAGLILFDRNYSGGLKLQVFLDKTFGANEVSIRWKNQLVGDEHLLDDYRDYLREALKSGEFAAEAGG